MTTAVIMTFYLKTLGGRPYIINAYAGTDFSAVGIYGKLDPNAVATAASPDHVVIAEDSFIYDMIPVAATGKIELISNTRKTGVILDNAAMQVGNVHRVLQHNPIPLAKGTDLMIQSYAVFP